jgi:hypothetical protein
VNRVDPTGEFVILLPAIPSAVVALGKAAAVVGFIGSAGLAAWKANEIFMSQHGKGNQTVSGIKEDYEQYKSEKKSENCPPDDPCEWLKKEEVQAKYTLDQIKATEKAWGCRRSRHFKGGKIR